MPFYNFQVKTNVLANAFVINLQSDAGLLCSEPDPAVEFNNRKNTFLQLS